VKRGRRQRRRAPAAPRPELSTEHSPAQPAPLSAGRRWLFRLIALVLLPVLVLSLLEGALRLAGYGYATGYFQRVRVGSKDFLVNNETFSLRFFPPQLARSPGPIMFEAEKPPRTFRIFILGESAARGEPEPPFGPGRYLEALLDLRFPAARFEVINTSMTAINSHVILPIARDCARQHGDLWILYIGNNEMVGPFGAATVFGARAPPLWAVRLGLAVQRTRVGQLLMAAARALRGKPAHASWGGMKMFLDNQLPPDDPQRETVYGSFQRNLRDIVRVGLDSGAKVILSTVAVNLKDCPPFASWPVTNLSAAAQAQFETLYQDACRAEDQDRFQRAAEQFEQADKIGGSSAELEFRLGDCLLQLTNTAAGREHFQRACDLDALPFRATSRINGIIRQTAGNITNPNLMLLDAETGLATNSLGGIPGEDLLWEHVHFTFEGGYQLGLAWANDAARFLPPALTNGAAPRWATQVECDERLALTDWNRCAVLDSVIWRLHRPPMSTQSNNGQRLKALERLERELRARLNPAAAAAARQEYLAAIQRRPGDHYLYENFAEFLESEGDTKDAAAQWRRVCELLPDGAFGYYQVGRLLVDQNQWAEAESNLKRAVALRPTLADAWFELGNIYMATDRLELGLEAFERARRLEPRDPAYSAFTAKALSQLGRHAESISRYRETLELKPDMSQARLALGDELVSANRLQEAQQEYAEAVRREPTNVLAHIDLGVILARRGQFDPALREFAETLRLEPDNKLAREYLDRVQTWKARRR
jgi:tetratricopeptide (TPR) repeat protein